MGKNAGDNPRDPLSSRLDELVQYPTHTAFSQLFCRLIVAWSWEAGDDAVQLRLECRNFLDAELWYHQQLELLSERENVTYEDVRSLADKRRINLTALGERLATTPAWSPRANVVRHLLLAESHYHLRETERVVEELEKAIESGGGHPIVHFALGYNRFDHAREIHAKAQESEGTAHARLDAEFREACLSAAEAFRDGLTGQVFDAQLHFWIGRALAAAGYTREAEAALETAARIDPSIFGREQESDGAREPQLDPTATEQPAESEGEEAPADEPLPISEEEVRRAAELLRRTWRVEDVLGEDG